MSRQAALLAQATLTKDDARVLVVGCGSAPDVRQALPWLRRSQTRIVLNDIDSDALAFCRRELAILGDRIVVYKGNALRCVRRMGSAGPFDLVLCGGLFDYLTNPQAVFLLRELKALLNQHDIGRLFFTNIVAGNPYRIWMEYFASWRLIERDDDEIRRLLTEAGFPLPREPFERDGSRLAWTIEVNSR